ncbi:MAG: formate dehydrogenase subunit gamma [Pseudomonadota bacterium]
MMSLSRPFPRLDPARAGLLTLLFMSLLAFGLLMAAGPAGAQTEGRAVESEAPTEGNVPGGHLGTNSDADFWRAIRHGEQGMVSIPDKQAGQMIQSEGDNWRAIRNGPISTFGIWVLLVMLGLLALFFALRGRIRIDAGPSGRTIQRFNGLERFAHWLTASSFIVLAITGLFMLYGRHLLGDAGDSGDFGALHQAYASFMLWGKMAHNYLAFAFMVGVALMFVLWVRHNLPNKYDLEWIALGGGMLSKSLHPPAKKFNAGQKVIFWSVILGGLSLGLSGVALLFPFQFSFFNDTFVVLNMVGFSLPTDLTPMQEMQLSQLWHTVVALVLIAIILAHIYIGSLGMEGAFAAVGTGQVDENWAREHHSVWVAQLKGEPLPEFGASARRHDSQQPAE